MGILGNNQYMSVDTLRTIQVVRDTIYVKGADALDILNKTDNFYTNAWNRLTIVLVIGSVLVPVAIAWFLNRQLKSNEQSFKDMVDMGIAKVKEEILSESDASVDNVLNQSKMSSYFILGELWLLKGNFRVALGMFATSIQYAILINDKSNVISALQRFRTSIFPKIEKADIDYYKGKIEFETIIANIKKMEVDFKVTEELDLFEEDFRKINI